MGARHNKVTNTATRAKNCHTLNESLKFASAIVLPCLDKNKGAMVMNFALLEKTPLHLLLQSPEVSKKLLVLAADGYIAAPAQLK